ncbi:MAG: hypothetical protein ABR559_06255, partial [Gemmatimonadota bacterium]
MSLHWLRGLVPFLVLVGCTDGPNGGSTRAAGSNASVAAGGRADGAGPAAEHREAARYLFVWAGDGDRRDSDFLAVLDVAPGGPRYGRLVATVPVGDRATMPHHVEHTLTAGQELFANGFMGGRTYRFDLRDPEAPRLAGAFSERAGFTYPHSYARLPNGHVLAAFQGRGPRNVDPGGLVELDAEGTEVRSASAADPRRPDALIRSYSLAVVPTLDRVVTTSYDMGEDMGFRGGRRGRTKVVQIWRLSDLGLLATIDLPPG